MEQELVNALESLKRAFETNVRDCQEWVQYRNAVAALRHAAKQSAHPTNDGHAKSDSESKPAVSCQ